MTLVSLPTTDHLLEELLARVDGHLVHVHVPLGLEEVQLPVIPERSPLGIDDHVILAREVLGIDRLDVLDVLQVAGVGSGAENQTNSASVVFPGTADDNND